MSNPQDKSAGIRGFALQLIDQRLTEEQKSVPQVQAMINAIKNNDVEAGINLATNICKSYNMMPQQIAAQVLGDLGLNK